MVLSIFFFKEKAIFQHFLAGIKKNGLELKKKWAGIKYFGLELIFFIVNPFFFFKQFFIIFSAGIKKKVGWN